MKPNAADSSVLLPEGSVKLLKDEMADGEYGLVINGHSLVCQRKFHAAARENVFFGYCTEICH